MELFAGMAASATGDATTDNEARLYCAYRCVCMHVWREGRTAGPLVGKGGNRLGLTPSLFLVVYSLPGVVQTLGPARWRPHLQVG